MGRTRLAFGPLVIMIGERLLVDNPEKTDPTDGADILAWWG
jgi:hypothetical protein